MLMKTEQPSINLLSAAIARYIVVNQQSVTLIFCDDLTDGQSLHCSGRLNETLLLNRRGDSFDSFRFNVSDFSLNMRPIRSTTGGSLLKCLRHANQFVFVLLR